MAEYSGEIVINTKINSEQAERSTTQLNDLFASLKATLESVGAELNGLLNEVGDNVKYIGKFMTGFAEGLADGLNTSTEAANTQLNGLFASLKATLESVGAELNGSLNEVGDNVNYIGEFMTGFAEGLADGLNTSTEAANQAGDAMQQTADTTQEAEKKVSKLKEAFLGLASTAWNGLKSIASHMANLVKSTRKTADNTSNMVKNFIKAAIGVQGLSAMLNKIKGAFQYGSKNLAGWSESYNSAISDITAGLNQLKNNIAAAFQPIVETVAPILSHFIDLLNEGVNKVAQFFAVLTGKNTYTKAIKQAEKLGSAQKKANKELKNGLNDLEELNVIGHDSDTASAVASDVKSGLFETANVDDSVSNFVDEIKKAFENGDFTEIGRRVGTKVKEALDNIPWDDIKDFANRTASSVATFLNGIVDSGVISSIGTAAAEGLNTVTGTVLTFAETFHWEEAGIELANGLSNFFETTDWGQAAQAISKTATGILKFLNAAISNVHWDEVGKAIVEFITNIDWLGIFGEATTLAGNVGKGIYELITGERVEGDFKDAMEEVAASIEDGTWIDAAKLWATDIFDGIKAVLGDAAAWIYDNLIKPIADALEAAGELKTAVMGDDKSDAKGFLGWLLSGMPDEAAPKSHSSSGAGFATGTVVPRTAKPFYGLLGDNDQETEVVSPLSTMKQAMLEAMAEGGHSNTPTTINLSIDGDKMFKWIVDTNKDETINRDRNPMFS